jgi:hypothetical protein
MPRSIEDAISLIRALKDNVAAKQQQIDHLTEQIDAADHRHRATVRENRRFQHAVMASYSEN